MLAAAYRSTASSTVGAEHRHYEPDVGRRGQPPLPRHAGFAGRRSDSDNNRGSTRGRSQGGPRCFPGALLRRRPGVREEAAGEMEAGDGLGQCWKREAARSMIALTAFN
jgi:hypothetical protein